ncbi:MAG: hypothetical protein IJ407_00185 [Clostridia bacterium]|nr:hypothetical protein [Clostridia bacterium]
MLFHILWVLVCFFAVIGILECLLGILNWFSFHRVSCVKAITVQIQVEGEMKNVEYLLNSLCLKAEKVDIGAVEARVELIDRGVTSETRLAIRDYCEKNPWVIFTEQHNNDIINK